jgi:AraC-like DNA-binding protein
MIDFSYLEKLPPLRRFYQLVWKLFGVSIGLSDAGGQREFPIGAEETRAPFCRKLHALGGGAHCRECDRRHFEIAARERRPVRYPCYLGMTEFIIPILLDGEVIAFLQSGQVLDAPPTIKSWNAVRRTLRSLSLDDSVLRPLYFSKSRVMPVEAQENFIALLELFSNYIAHTQNQILIAEQPWNSQVVTRARAHIRDHLDSPLTLDGIARAAFTSKRNLTRVFRKETGSTVIQYIHETRIVRACREIAAGRKSITQIALDGGFGSVQQFNRVFLKVRNTTPLVWKKSIEGGMVR